ncbi:hypothetical protein HDV01_003414 [Terramyces sp. JEL0728]|nr:hypothetical protein HDV01_003414 [Terramyces sp. JEL0728]
MVMADYAGSYSSQPVKKCRAGNIPTVTVNPTTTVPVTTTTTVAPAATKVQFANLPKPQQASFAPNQQAPKPAPSKDKPKTAAPPAAPLAKGNPAPPQPKPAAPPKQAANNNGQVTVAGIKLPAAIVNDAQLCLSEVINIVQLPKTGSFNGDCLSLHNTYRSVLGLGPYTFDANLQNVAQGVVNNLAAKDAFEHSGLGFGENLHQQSGGSTLSCGDAVKAWFAEFKFYNGVPIGSGNFHEYGHFTQVISPQSTSFGCAVAPYTAPDGTFKQTVACEYSPAGNIEGSVLNMFVMGSNACGQLGTGDKEDRNTPTEISVSASKCAAGSNHTLVLVENTVYAAGDNSYGQLATAGTELLEFQAIHTSNNIVNIFCGWNSSYITTKDYILGTGENTFGALGIESKKATSFATIELKDIVKISTGMRHTLFLSGNGQVYGCGTTRQGALSLNRNDIVWVPLRLFDKVDDIACGQFHSLILKANKVFGFGRNKFRQLKGDFQFTVDPVEIELAGIPKSIYSSWSAVAVLTDKGLVMWGRSDFGQCSGPFDSILDPSSIANVQLAFGSEHALLLVNGRVHSWGWNEHGNCGNGTNNLADDMDGNSPNLHKISKNAGVSKELLEKRQRNSEAARRCRDKIKNKIELLEKENQELLEQKRDLYLRFVQSETMLKTSEENLAKANERNNMLEARLAQFQKFILYTATQGKMGENEIAPYVGNQLDFQ